MNMPFWAAIAGVFDASDVVEGVTSIVQNLSCISIFDATACVTNAPAVVRFGTVAPFPVPMHSFSSVWKSHVVRAD